MGQILSLAYSKVLFPSPTPRQPSSPQSLYFKKRNFLLSFITSLFNYWYFWL